MGNYILLGGAGFIGQNLAKHLLTLNHNVTIYDRNIVNKILDLDLFNRCSIIEKDLFYDDKLGENMKDIDCIIHLISSISPQSSMQEIYKGYENDLIKTIELCEICREKNIKRIIFLSSGGTVYGNQNAIKYKEEMQTYPINNYGIVKLAIEKVLLMYNSLYNMENIILRVSNPYGIGQNPSKKVGAISVFADSIFKRKEILIYGDGNNVRDYIEINDVCKGIVSSISYKFDKNIVPIFNIGSGTGYTINSILRIIENKLNIDANVKYLPARSIDVKSNILDITKAQEVLDYKCSITLEIGIENFITKTKREYFS